MKYNYGECKNTTVVSEYGDTYTMINVSGYDAKEIELNENFGCIFFEPKD